MNTSIYNITKVVGTTSLCLMIFLFRKKITLQVKRFIQKIIEETSLSNLLRFALSFLLVISLSSMSVQSFGQINEKLYLNTSGVLSRSVEGTSGNTVPLTKQSATVTSSGTFKTGQSGSTTGNLSSSSNFTPSGTNRAIVVSIGSVSGVNNAVSSVTFGAQNFTKIGQVIDVNNRKLELWYLLSPNTTPSTITINWPSGQTLEAAVGVVLLNTVDQNDPFGTLISTTNNTSTASIFVESAPGDIIIDAIGSKTNNITAGTGQTQVFSDGTNSIDVRSSYKAASSGITSTTSMSWTGLSTSTTWAMLGVAVKGLSNDVSFTQSASLCSDLVIEAGSLISVSAAATVFSGAASGATLPVNAVLSYGNTEIIHLTQATNMGLGALNTSGTLTWSGTLVSNVTVPAGSSIVLTIYNDYPSASFVIAEGNLNSFISIPSTSFEVNSIEVYSAAFNGGSSITTGDIGATQFLRAGVIDPFGDSDIASLGFIISKGGVSTTVSGVLVDTNSGTCTKTYEYQWTPSSDGVYSITATATNNQANNSLSRVTSFVVNPDPCPDPVDDETGTVIGLPVTSSVLDNDPTPGISPVVVTGPSFGSVVVNVNNTITYTPFPGFKGIDSFTYKICEDAGAATATVRISVVDGIAIKKDTSSDLGVPAVSDAVKYAWSGFPSGAKITYTNSLVPQVSPPTTISNSADIIETTIPSLTVDWTGILPGTYSICVSAINDCGESTQICTDVVITEEIPTPAYDVKGLVSNAYCGRGGSITEIEVLVGGVLSDPSNFTYSWTGPSSFESTSKDLSSGLVQGEYVLTVREGSNVVAIKYFYIEYSCLGVAKEVSAGPVSNGDGTYLLSYRIKVENIGSTTINSIQVAEDLKTTFLDVTKFEVLGLSSANFTVNPAFNGDTDTNLISSTALGNLNAARSGYILIDLKVTPGAFLGPYDNQVAASGQDPTGLALSDFSHAGNDTDPNGNGPQDNSDPTSVTFTENPVIGVSKTILDGPENQGDGSYLLTYGIKVQNHGNILLTNVQVVEDLAATFSDASIEVISLTSSAGGFTLNSLSFDGSTDKNLLTGSNSLAVNGIKEIELKIKVSPTSVGPFNNTVTASATGPGGTATEDLSQNGTNPDPDNNNNPRDNDTPTPITFEENPAISLAKRVVGDPVNNGDDTYNVTYSFYLKNTGDVPLSGVQIEDDLNAVFGNKLVEKVLLTSSSLTVNSAYNGVDQKGLLAAAQTLAVGTSATVELIVKIRPGADLGPYQNQATATATSSLGTVVTDLSQDGFDPDPENDGSDNNRDLTPVSFTENPEIGIAKSLVSSTNNGDGTYTIEYNIKAENTGDVVLTNLQVVDDLNLVFGDKLVEVVDLFSPEFNENFTFDGCFNVGYDGLTDTNLLLGNEALAVGASGTITLKIKVRPGSNLGPYSNLAIASGTSPRVYIFTDTSTNGSDVDPDFDGNPTNNQVPTPVSFTESPSITVNKTAGVVTELSTGVYRVPYVIEIANNGDVFLADVQVVEDLSSTFPEPATFTIASFQVAGDLTTGTNFISNPDFDGKLDFNLFTGVGELLPGKKAVVNLVVEVTTDQGGLFDNEVYASGVSPKGSTRTAYDFEPVTINERPLLGIAKKLWSLVPIDDLTYDVTFQLTLKNHGNVLLSNLEIFDDIVTQFGGLMPSGFETILPVGVSPATIEYNLLFGKTAWNGTSTSNILVSGQELAPDQTGTIWIKFTVTPGATESVINSASAKASTPSGLEVTDISQDGLVPDSDDEGTDPQDDSDPTLVEFFQPDPALSMVKTGVFNDENENGRADVGETISYTFLVRNTGNVPLTNVTVSDPKVTVSGEPISLAVGANSGSTFTATYTITQSDINAGKVDNTATADSDESDPASAEETTPLTQAPSLSLVKTGVFNDENQNGRADVGETISYTFLVSNTGNVPLTNVTVSDPKVTVSGGPISLAVGANSGSTFTATYTITESDINAGKVDNTATADSDESAPESAEVTTPLTQAPSLSLVKSGEFNDENENGRADIGETISYTFLVSNTGNVPLNNVTVSDPKVTVSGGPISLAVGANSGSTFTATYTITQSDINEGKVDNTATADSDESDSKSDEETTDLPQRSDIVVTKTAIENSYDSVGDLINYSIRVENSGNITLTNVKVVDPLTQLEKLIDVIFPGMVEFIETSYRVTQADIDSGKVYNIATASSGEAQDSNDETVLANQRPSMAFSKSSTATGYEAPGDILTYTLTLVNTGNVTISEIVVSDPKATTGPDYVRGDINANGKLDVGEAWEYSASVTVNQGDIDAGSFTNIASASGKPAGGELDPVSDQETVQANQRPSWTLSKTASEKSYGEVGDVLNYTIVVTNTGNVTISGVEVYDPQATTGPDYTSGDKNSNAKLDVGESWTFEAAYEVKVGDLEAGKFTNKATATGTIPGGGLGQAEASHTVSALIVMPEKYYTPYDTSVSGDVSENDTYPAGSTFTQSSQPSNGSGEFSTKGEFTYETNEGFTGIDSFTYTVCLPNPNTMVCEATTVTVVVGPRAEDDNYVLLENRELTTTVKGNDTYPTGSEFSQTSDPSHGKLIFNSDGTFTYVPYVNYSGTDNFTYKVCFTEGDVSLCEEATVTLKILLFSTEPDVNATFVDIPVNGSVSTNDKVTEASSYGDPGSPLSQPEGSNPTLTLKNDGTYTFKANLPGVYVYLIPICSPLEGEMCRKEPLTITVLDVNVEGNGPIAHTDIAQTRQGVSVTLQTLSNDRPGSKSVELNPGSVTLVVQPKHGRVSINTETGTITYTPDADFVGEETYRYQVCDTSDPAKCVTAEQKVTVLGQNAPNSTIASDDFAITSNKEKITGNVLKNDSDSEGNIQQVIPNRVSIPEGDFEIDEDGNYSFTPTPGFIGPAEIVYQLCDNGDPKACARATIYFLIVKNSIEAVNDNFQDKVINGLNGGVAGNVLTNDLLNERPVTAQEVKISILSDGGLTGVEIDNQGRLIVPKGTAIGTYIVHYKICEVVDSSNCSDALAIVEVFQGVDLAIGMRTDETLLWEGDDFDYILTVGNVGDTDATEIVVEDNLPSGLEYKSSKLLDSDGLQLNTVVEGQKVTMKLAALKVGQVVEINLGVKARSLAGATSETILNTASVSSKETELNPSDNTTSTVVQIQPFFIPNVITPNGDRKNDAFVIKGLGKFASNEITIFNRYGDHVYQKKGYQNDWRGEGLIAGTYFYILSVVDINGNPTEFKGWIQLIRE